MSREYMVRLIGAAGRIEYSTRWMPLAEQRDKVMSELRKRPFAKGRRMEVLTRWARITHVERVGK